MTTAPKPSRYCSALILSFTVTITTAALTHVARTRHSARQVMGDPRILKQSEHIFRSITNSHQPANTLVHTFTRRLPNGTAVPSRVRLELQGDTSDSVVVSEWDAATIELREVTSTIVTKHDPRVPPMTRLEAARRAVHWLKVLGIESTSPRWKLGGEPRHDSNSGLYVVRWVAPDRDATFTMQDQTGELILATTERVNWGERRLTVLRRADNRPDMGTADLKARGGVVKTSIGRVS